jgi:hypothetical protein
MVVESRDERRTWKTNTDSVDLVDSVAGWEGRVDGKVRVVTSTVASKGVKSLRVE